MTSVYHTNNNTPISKYILDKSQVVIDNISISDLYNYPHDRDTFSTIANMYRVNNDMISVRYGTDGVIKDTLYEFKGQSIYYKSPNYGMLDYYTELYNIRHTGFSEASVIYISTPNPSNGLSVSDSDIITYISENLDKFFIIDLSYDIYVKDSLSTHIEYVEKLSLYSNVMTLISFSKMTGLTGLRVGIGISSLELTSRQPWNITSISLKIFQEIFTPDIIQRHKEIINKATLKFIEKEGDNISFATKAPIVLLKEDILEETRYYSEYKAYRYSVIDGRLE